MIIIYDDSIGWSNGRAVFRSPYGGITTTSTTMNATMNAKFRQWAYDFTAKMAKVKAEQLTRPCKRQHDKWSLRVTKKLSNGEAPVPGFVWPEYDDSLPDGLVWLPQ